MILINEFYRIKYKEKPTEKHNEVIIIGTKKEINRCSWYCHDTDINDGCKSKHNPIIKNKSIDKVYRKILEGLHKGNYVVMNIIFLVILWPLLMYIFLLKCINIQQKINFMKKKN